MREDRYETEDMNKGKAQLKENGKRIEERVHHSLRICTAAAKKAKVFEAQKCIRRIKAASDDGKTLLQNELEALKSVDNAYIGAIALRAKLVKAKLLPKGNSSSGKEQEFFSLQSVAGPLHSAIQQYTKKDEVKSAEEERAHSRLLSNKGLSEEISKAVAGISKALEKEDSKIKETDGDAKKGDLQSSHAKNFNKQSKSSIIDSPSSEQLEGLSAPSLNHVTKDFGEGESILKSKGEKVEVKKTILKRKIDAVSNALKDPAIKSMRVSVVAEGDSSDEIEKSLPKLSTGFVGGRGFNLGRGSDDEWSDGDADFESIDEDDGVEQRKEIRKNRMGQRARRAIWEKKFGKGANHLKLKEKESRSRRGITERRPGKDYPSRSDGGWTGRLASKNLVKTGPKTLKPSNKAVSEIEMHPSWIAKQKEKQRREAAVGSGAAMQAKKIVFE